MIYFGSFGVGLNTARARPVAGVVETAAPPESLCGWLAAGRPNTISHALLAARARPWLCRPAPLAATRLTTSAERKLRLQSIPYRFLRHPRSENAVVQPCALSPPRLWTRLEPPAELEYRLPPMPLIFEGQAQRKSA